MQLWGLATAPAGALAASGHTPRDRAGQHEPELTQRLDDAFAAGVGCRVDLDGRASVGCGYVTLCPQAYMLEELVRNSRHQTAEEQRVDVSELDLVTEQFGGLPVINTVYDRLGLAGLFEAHVPTDDVRLRLSPAAALGVVVRNLVIHREPVYALGEWAAPYDPVLLGLTPEEAGLLNDDRIGRMLARLFDADRASLLTRLVLDAVESFDIDVSQLHNDSTSLKFSGAYQYTDGRERGGTPTPAVKHGFSKDLPSHCVVSHLGVANSPGWSSSTWIRRPLRLPRRTCTALSSPRWTRCNTVWRAMPRMAAA